MKVHQSSKKNEKLGEAEKSAERESRHFRKNLLKEKKQRCRRIPKTGGYGSSKGCRDRPEK